MKIKYELTLELLILWLSLFVTCTCQDIYLYAATVNSHDEPSIIDTSIHNLTSINTTINSSVTFTCIANADVLNFLVDGLQVDNRNITERGFREVVTVDGPVITAKLIAVAYKENNGSNISCTALARPLNSHHIIDSSIERLFVQGPLTCVGDLTAIPLNGVSIQLTWTPPYTLDNVPIIGYYIDIINTTVNDTHITLPTPTDPDSCKLINVSIAAVNEAGIGEPAYTSFYYESVSQNTIPVEITSVVNRQNDHTEIELFIYVIVTQICPGEYPDFVDVKILDENYNSQHVSTLSLLNTEESTTVVVLKGNNSVVIPFDLVNFYVNVTLRNNAGVLPKLHLFRYTFLGPVYKIRAPLSNNCTSVVITWEMPKTIPGAIPLRILYYKLQIFKDEQIMLELNVSNTSYQFEDNNLFHHRYTYVIAAVNELGEGDPHNETLIYERVPRSVINNVQFSIENYGQENVSIFYKIPVILECENEAPKEVQTSVQCTKNSTFKKQYTLKGSLSIENQFFVARHQFCSLNVEFLSNISANADSLKFNLSTYDVALIESTVEKNSICSTCTLSSIFSEGCFVNTTSSTGQSWNMTLLVTDKSSAYFTVQGCVDDIPADYYTIYAYDLVGGQPIQPAAASTVVAVTLSSSIVASPTVIAHQQNGFSLETLLVASIVPSIVILLFMLGTTTVLSFCLYRIWKNNKKNYSAI